MQTKFISNHQSIKKIILEITAILFYKKFIIMEEKYQNFS